MDTLAHLLAINKQDVTLVRGEPTERDRHMAESAYKGKLRRIIRCVARDSQMGPLKAAGLHFNTTLAEFKKAARQLPHHRRSALISSFTFCRSSSASASA